MNKRKNDDLYRQDRKRKNDEPRIGDFFEDDDDDLYDDEDDSDIPRSRKVHLEDDDYQEFLEFKRWKKHKKHLKKAKKMRKKRRYHKGESLLKKLWDLID